MTSKTSSDPPNSSSAERRASPRYALVAIAEITNPEDAKLISGKVTQISRSGCYVDSPKTLPIGVSLKVIIFREQRTFVARANVIHVQEQMGMGMAFLDPSEDQLKILDSWLAELPSASTAG